MEGLNVLFESSVLWVFVCVFIIVLCFFLLLLHKDFRGKQMLYRRFSGNLSEYIVVLSQKMEFLYGLPKEMPDPVFQQLSEGKSFDEILSASNMDRMKIYFENIERHLDLPFLFSYSPDSKNLIDGEQKTIWYELLVSIQRISSVEFRYVCFVKNITKIYETRIEKEMVREDRDWLLKNTGDFLWQFDVESRSFYLRTSMMDESHSMLPLPAGIVDVHTLMPEEDLALFDKVVNNRVKVFKEKGFGGDPFEIFKVRFYGVDKKLVWYGLRGKVSKDENEHFWFQGVARRIDMALDNIISDGSNDKEAMLSACLAFPDVRTFWIERDFKIQGCNQAFAMDFQIIDPCETIGKNLEQVVGRKFLPYITHVLSEVLDTERCVSWKGDFEGRLLMFNAVPLKNSENVTYSVIVNYIFLASSDFTDEI